MTAIETTALAWGIKKSFLGYLENLPDCMFAENDGASRDPDTGLFQFPFQRRVELDEGGYRLEFSGDIRIKAHGGMLLVILMNPWLEINERGIELSVVDLMHWPDTSNREVIGHSPITVAPENLRSQEIPLILAESAVETFNNVYQPGEPLDPVVLI
ncbi:hypothetical protein J433_00790 [Corynebacterium glutamicum MT]|uniref:Htaa domain-containing protein n=1 Tax=Corynebacterium glutamicum TaxID=1718 RepID=A0AB36I8X2_CORGT|nr:HtaA domain-containing protein [Corynebacterium glutamicum]AGN17746.1 hypothetical protein C624_00775 [Corynebacterium glutamicum SCgG1]AGN20769.1 hypothetical protein C629_00775 [Corynebacterium glutamicum SCgG2]EGV39954.1 hypothetical protein CgS9114_10927 [Corynebacterium glutamicum S9114]EOA65985.1 hypothetical protein J433_00790 [Corynebacterium glutamicum MT]EPP42052.1 hypothetical protein A583_00310 [Corynebacterium glutamicum Z188]